MKMDTFNYAPITRAVLDSLEDPFRPVARRPVSKASLRRRRRAKRNAVLLALAADRTGSARGIARALYRELRRYAAGRRFRSTDADARAPLLHRFITLNAGNPLSEGTIRGVLAGT